MTISNAEALFSGPYSGDGVTATFDYDFKIYDAEELVVERTVDDVTTTLVYETDYTVAGAGDAGGGSITLLDPATDAPTGATLYVLPNIEFSQTRPFGAQSSVSLNELEQSFDKITSITRQLRGASDRSIRLPVGSAASGLLPNPTTGSVLVWDEDGLTNGPAPGDLTEAMTARDEALASEEAAAISAAAAAISAAAAASETTFATRASMLAATIPAPVSQISCLHDGHIVTFARDATGTAATTADGAKWSPAGDATPQHWGALSDGTDASAAVTSFLAYMRDEKRKGLASGPFTLDSAVSVTLDGTGRGEHISLEGSGLNSDTWLVNNATGGITFAADGAQRAHSVHLENMHFAPALADSGYPFKILGIDGGLQKQSVATVNDVTIGPLDDDADLDFSEGPSVTGVFFPVLQNVRIFQTATGTVNKWSHGLDLSGTFKPFLDNVWINTVTGGADYGIKDIGTTGEGGTYYNCTTNGADVGFEVTRTGREPEFWWDKGHINHNGIGMRINGVKFGNIVKPLIYMGTAAAAASGVDILVEDADGLLIDQPQFRAPGVTGGNYRHITLEPKSGKAGAVVNRIHIKLSEASLFGNTTVKPIYCNGATNVVIELPEGTDTADSTSYPADLVQFGPSQDATEVTIIRPSGLVSRDASSSAGPVFVLDRSSDSPANNDKIGRFVMQGRNAAGSKTEYARRNGFILLPTTGAEYGQVDDEILIDGAQQIVLRLLRAAANGETAMFVAVRDSGVHSLQRVTVGAADSGGTGFRVLRIPNA